MSEQNSTMEIYLSRAGQITGPYTLREAKARLLQGEFAAGDHAWSEGDPAWIPVEEHRLLKGYCSAAPTNRNRKPWLLIGLLGGAGVFGAIFFLVFGLLATTGEETGVASEEETRELSPEEFGALIADQLRIRGRPPAVQERQSRAQCRSCQGSGQSRGRGTCTSCAGNGVITTRSGHAVACSRCSGTGSPPSQCVICGGSGYSTQSGKWDFGYR